MPYDDCIMAGELGNQKVFGFPTFLLAEGIEKEVGWVWVGQTLVLSQLGD